MSIPYSFSPLGGGSLPYKKRLAYLESTGTQWIDTGIIFDPAQSMEGRVRTATLSTNRTVPFSSFYSGSVASFGVEWGGLRINHSYTPRGYIQIPNTLEIWADVQPVNTPVDIRLLWSPHDKTAELSVDGVEYAGQGTGSIGQPGVKTIRMFLDNRTSTAGIAYGTRIYSLSLRQAGALVRAFIPVLDMNDVPCMYDQVSKTFFYNQGTGTFNYGEL